MAQGETKTRLVLVTAGASGIGLAIAERFLVTGAHVHIFDIDDVAIRTAVAANDGLTGSFADMGDPKSVKSAIRDLQDQHGPIDVLVNNAGIGGGRALIEDVSLSDWQRCLDVNLSGPFYAMQAVIPGMKAHRSGVILNISTTAARTALPQRTPYVVSKTGLAGLTHNAARELGPFNIRVNSILPGLINNERGRKLLETAALERGVSLDEVSREVRRYISMRCVVEMREIGDMAVFLASDAAAHVTAQEISVDGNLEWDI